MTGATRHLTLKAEPVVTATSSTASYARGLLRLNQPCGEFEDQTRAVWVRREAITHFTESMAWRKPGMGPVPRGTLLHLISGETCSVIEPPELIAAWLRRPEESAP